MVVDGKRDQWVGERRRSQRIRGAFGLVIGDSCFLQTVHTLPPGLGRGVAHKLRRRLHNLVRRGIVFDRNPVIRKALANLGKRTRKVRIPGILG